MWNYLTPAAIQEWKEKKKKEWQDKQRDSCKIGSMSQFMKDLENLTDEKDPPNGN